MNQNEFLDLFVKRFTSIIDDDTMRERLLTRSNNCYGKSPEDLAEQLELNTHALAEARRSGSIVTDAAGPSPKLRRTL